ncbi:DUF4430 domain-containing protein [Rhodopirellula europaea]|uniref:Transcobalamin-like C-terminal domain-containing protein n=1 Tax=Rhodopirellula europaea 6C TaxID=1263867 RepID=M2B255_9BACT|nr:DUF4430 domain-containing protein [Rhodopirellula europaea]EMB15873.1 hypothetical protein RE6C_03467 [Rhodopirellula europaea 6C]
MFLKTTSNSLPAAGHFLTRVSVWRFSPLAPVLFVAILLSVVGCGGSTAPVQPPVIEDYPSTGEVTFEFVIDEETTKSYVVDNVASGTTLETLMRDLSSPKMEIGGEGTTAFVESIEGVATNATHGWTFTVDGEFATNGIGTTELDPPNTIVWKYTTFEEAIAERD